MNSLSWFLYAADLVDGLPVLFFVFGLMFLVVPVFVFSIRTDFGKPNPLLPYAVCFIFSVLLLLLSVILPSKNTMYAIAASELGQKAVESELVGKALKAIEHWINNQVKK